MENPANGIKDTMWHFLMDGKQKENIPELKDAVYRLIQMATQKTAGQPKYAKATQISWDTLDMEIMRIVCEATALVLSERLDELEEKHNPQREEETNMVSVEETLEAYNTIRKYCGKRECDTCFFQRIEGSCECVMGEGAPEEWQKLPLDRWNYKYNSGQVTSKDKRWYGGENDDSR